MELLRKNGFTAVGEKLDLVKSSVWTPEDGQNRRAFLRKVLFGLEPHRERRCAEVREPGLHACASPGGFNAGGADSGRREIKIRIINVLIFL